MANNTGRKFGGRTKGTPNKLTAETRERLQCVIDDTLESLDLNEMSIQDKLRFLEIALKHTLPTLKQVENSLSSDFSYNDIWSKIQFASE